MKYIELLHKIAEIKRLSATAKALAFDLTFLWYESHKQKGWDGYFFATDKQIGEKWSKATYARARKELIDKGVIECKRGRCGKPSKYRYLF